MLRLEESLRAEGSRAVAAAGRRHILRRRPRLHRVQEPCLASREARPNILDFNLAAAGTRRYIAPMWPVGGPRPAAAVI